MQVTNTFTIGFIGGGNMAQALITGLKSQAFAMHQVLVVDLDEEKRSQLEKNFGVRTTADISDTKAQDVIVMAVKPQQLKTVSQTLAPNLQDQLVISIAAGINLDMLSGWLDGYQNIVRTMPNTPAQIQAGITGMYALPKVSAENKVIAETILKAAGETLWLSSEDQLDAVTAISGSGPAYVFYLIEALTEAGLTLGLTTAQADLLAKQTFKGASLLADISDTPVSTLREQVTSKGGTTEQGLLSLAESQVNTAIIKAAQAAEKRAKLLADELGK